jgi:hypothetical protein
VAPATEEVAWAAGLFEGEGYVSTINGGTAPRLGLGMSDPDVVYRFAKVIGVSEDRVYVRDPYGRGKKKMYEIVVTRRDDVERILSMLLPYLGERRSARVQEVLLLPRLSVAYWGRGRK